jgi:SAM-dependent methyltransferase
MTNIINREKRYYENDVFWNPKAQVNAETSRIVFTSRLIPSNVKTIADIGCGNGLFLNYLSESETNYKKLLGVDRSNTALSYVKTNKICADISNLPLDDKSYDLVSALEVIEHLSLKEYSDGLRELARISKKYLLISVPYQEVLQTTLSECPKCKTRFNTDYHRRSFDQETMKKMFGGMGFKNKTVGLFGDTNKLWLLTPLFEAYKKVNPPPVKVPVPCPVCGYNLDPLSDGASKSRHSLYRYISTVAKYIRPFWPKYHGKRWIIALYERVAL